MPASVSLADLSRSSSAAVPVLVKVNGELGASRWAMGPLIKSEVPMDLKGKLVIGQNSSSSLQRLIRVDQNPIEPFHSRFGNSSVNGPATLGGNTGRMNSHGALLMARADPPLDERTFSYGKPRPQRATNPVTWTDHHYAKGLADHAKPLAGRSLRGSASHSSLMHGSKPVIFPARGTINMIGASGSSSTLLGDGDGGSSPSKSQSKRGAEKTLKLEYELWCEAQARATAEREYRQVVVHGRSRPPWVGDPEEIGYQPLIGRSRSRVHLDNPSAATLAPPPHKTIPPPPLERAS